MSLLPTSTLLAKGKGRQTQAWQDSVVELQGAKKGGLTQHIAGPHLIPNKGREAMVPREVVRRRQPAAPKLTQLERLSHGAHLGQDKRDRSEDRKRRRRKGRRSRSRSKRSRSRNDDDSSDEDRRVRDERSRKKREELDKKTEEERKVAEDKAKEAVEAHLADVRRRSEEAAKLKQVQQARKSNLQGIFALSEEQMGEVENDDEEKKRLAEERARADQQAKERRHNQRSHLEHKMRALDEDLTKTKIPGAGTPFIDPTKLPGGGFEKCWKDWDQAKQSDPGELARQFMKVSAMKRPRTPGDPPPGSDPSRYGPRGYKGARTPSRSRSRRRSRR